MGKLVLETYRVALPIILTAFMGYIVWLLKEQKKDRDANTEGTKMLLMIKMFEYHDKYMALTYIPSHAYSNFQKMYQWYIDMGDGNPSVKKMKQEIDELYLKRKEVEQNEKY